jgi:conjugal transfer pilus assembly protein TraU
MRFKLFFLLCLLTTASFSKSCEGSFVNPMNVCWKCLFPLSIGNTSVVNSELPDTKNPKMVIGFCPAGQGVRVGLNIGFWEPFSLVDVTDTPYCLVNLGGHRLNLGKRQGSKSSIDNSAFYHVHWYKYPLIAWLNIITSAGCFQGGDFDVAYMTELDPTWQDSEMSFVLNPEAILFSNPVAQAACSVDALSSSFRKKPLDSLFWCAGSHGIMYPLNGFVLADYSPVQTALLLAERMNFKLHREFLIEDSIPIGNNVCHEYPVPVLPKSRYRYEMVNQVMDGKNCYPSGYLTLLWEAGKIKPHTQSQFGFLVWRKRNCTFL